VPAEASDAAELRQLVEVHGDAVFRLALSIVRDAALAEDIAQDSLVKAWLALPSLNDRSALKSWLMRITHNTAISTLRARRAVVVDPHELPDRPAQGPTVETRVQSDAVMGDFVAALDQLDDLSRSIVVLRELEGLAYEEIAQVLQVPLPTVKTRLLRARRRLGPALRGWT
jgi:RNA polymerase sigma-70 factor (ECF subfamily)